MEVIGHDPDQEPEAFDNYCPIRSITKDYPPTLLLHGDEDTDVPYEQSVLMAAELERHCVDHKMIPLAGHGHGFDGAMQNPVVAQAFVSILKFLEDHLK